jgi:beta-glucanase (GH16 family)
MKHKPFNYSKIILIRLAVPVITVLLILGITACEKDEVPGFNADFSIEILEENYVKFTNQSTGEYYWIIYDYGNGEVDTIIDKKAQPEVFYSVAGTYNVSMQVTNYYGEVKTVTKSFGINDNNVQVSFTAEPYEVYPNFVQITNTSLGVWDSITWTVNGGDPIKDIETFTEYFAFAGDYELELSVRLFDEVFTEIQTVTISQDDPDYDPTMVWREEFINTGSPDPTKWNLETGGGGWGNDELQTYTDFEDNVYVDNGVLTITAIDKGEDSYTSARITTQGKYDFKYGRIEARIKLPYGKGMWPAFWMLGANFNEVGWPYCGEIDIMEMVGGDEEPNSDNTCHATMHWWADSENVKADYGLSYTLPSGIFADNFHVFGIEWDEQSVRAYMDGNEYFVADITPSDLSEFRQNFFIILNLAVGGNWPGDPCCTDFPQTMQVDWIRVYSE